MQKKRLYDKQMYKNYAFTCHPLHYLSKPSQLENTLHQKLYLKGSHPHLHGERKLHGFPELKTRKLPGKQIREAALSKYYNTKHLIVMQPKIVIHKRQVKVYLHKFKI